MKQITVLALVSTKECPPTKIFKISSIYPNLIFLEENNLFMRGWILSILIMLKQLFYHCLLLSALLDASLHVPSIKLSA